MSQSSSIANVHVRVIAGRAALLLLLGGALPFGPRLAAQSANEALLPAPFPRRGATLLYENARVAVWDVAWLKERYPLHKHVRDLVVVFYTAGDRVIIEIDGRSQRVSTRPWEVRSQRAGRTHIEEGASADPLRGVFIEFKEPALPTPAGGEPRPSAFAAALGAPELDFERARAWLVSPSAASGTHQHGSDAVVVSFAAGRPSVAFVERGTTHTGEGAGGERVYLFELK